MRRAGRVVDDAGDIGAIHVEGAAAGVEVESLGQHIAARYGNAARIAYIYVVSSRNRAAGVIDNAAS